MSSSAIINLVIQLLAGAGGGNALGKALQQFSLGPLGNTIVGLIGGVAGGSWLGPLISGVSTTTQGAGLDVGAIGNDIIGGGIGGAVLTLIIGAIRKMMSGGGAAT
jgi:hypothetical protein